MRFDAATYPGHRPAGPVLVHRGQRWPVRADGTVEDPVAVPDEVADAPVLRASDRRWSLAFGANADTDRLVDRGLDRRGVLVVPASVLGWETAWEARRAAATGAVPLTLSPAPGHRLDTYVVGVHVDDLDALDRSEVRGTDYVLGRVGPVAVAGRWLLPDALAYGPGRRTMLLDAGDGRPATHPRLDQQGARGLLDGGAGQVAAPPLPHPVEGVWPDTPLEDLPLFVYGTLQPGQQRWSAIDRLVSVVGSARVPGRLFATPHGWPAAVAEGSGWVHGTLLQPRDPAAARWLYARTDEIEGTPTLFRRVALPTVAASAATADTVWAATYVWADAERPPGNEVPDGRWIG